jgi:hypothetical protein
MKKPSLPFLAQSCIFLHTLLLACSWLTLNYYQILSLEQSFSGDSVAIFLPWLFLVLLDALLLPSFFAVLYIFYTRIGKASRSPIWRDLMSGYALPVALLLTAVTSVFATALFSSPRELLLLFPVFLWFLLKALGAPLAAWTVSRKAFLVAIVPALLTFIAYIGFGLINAGNQQVSPELLANAHALFFLIDYALSLWLYVLLAKLTRKEFYSPVLQTIWALFLIAWLLSFAASYYADLQLKRSRRDIAATWGAPLDSDGIREVYYNGHEPDSAFFAALQEIGSQKSPSSTTLIQLVNSLSSMPVVNEQFMQALDEELAAHRALIELVDQRLSSNKILKLPLLGESSSQLRALPYLSMLQEWSSLLPARVLSISQNQDPLALARLWQCAHALHLSLAEEPFAASLQANLQCLHHTHTALTLAINAELLDENTTKRIAQDLHASRACLKKQLPLMRYGESALLNVAFEEIMQDSYSQRILLFNTSKLRPLLAPLYVFLRYQQREALTLFIQEDFCGDARILKDWGVPLLLSSMKTLSANVQSASTKQCLLSSAIALERHLQQSGSFPDTLEQLVPAYLSSVPRDPFNDQALRYEKFAESIPIVTIQAQAPAEMAQTDEQTAAANSEDEAKSDEALQWQALTSEKYAEGLRIWSVGRNLIDNCGQGHGGQFDDICYTRVKTSQAGKSQENK